MYISRHFFIQISLSIHSFIFKIILIQLYFELDSLRKYINQKYYRVLDTVRHFLISIIETYNNGYYTFNNVKKTQLSLESNRININELFICFYTIHISSTTIYFSKSIHIATHSTLITTSNYSNGFINSNKR